MQPTEVREFTNPEINKSDWGEGPWQAEPDKIQWVDPATDLDCLMVRHEDSGHWCGYVGVAEGHPAFAVGYFDVGNEQMDLAVHGGLTYSDFCDDNEENPAAAICHVPFPGRPHNIWWLGFDCAHAMDLSPAREVRDRQFRFKNKMGDRTWDLEYRDRAYVEKEIADLAGQLKAMATDGTHS